METAILSGLDASKALYQSLEERIARLKDQNITPGLAAVLVGNNPASEIYVKNKTKKFEALGLKTDVFRLEESVSEYSQQIHHYNTKNWMWEHYGNSNKESGSQMSSTGSHQAETSVGGMSLFTLSEQYGQAVNVGGNTTMYTGSITLTGSQ